jgi:hypothetical protein
MRRSTRSEPITLWAGSGRKPLLALAETSQSERVEPKVVNALVTCNRPVKPSARNSGRSIRLWFFTRINRSSSNS